MAHFKHGRTETIRSLTQEMKDFVLAFEDPAVSAQVKVEAFKKGSFSFGLGLIKTQLLLDTLMSPRTPNLVRDKTGTCKASIGLLNNALSAFMIGKLRRYLIPLIGRPCLTDYLLPTLVEALQVCQQSYLFLLFYFSMFNFHCCSSLSLGKLSLSQHLGVRLFGFGAVHMEGLGVGYMINDDSLPGTVTSYSGKAKLMADNTVQALRELSALCEGAAQK